MGVVRYLVFLAGLAAVWAPLSCWAGERLQVPELVGWRVVGGARDSTGESTELIPGDQQPDGWTRRVTIQAFRKARVGVTEFLDQVVQQTASVCDGAAAGPPSRGKVSGAEAATRTVACGRYKGDGRGNFTLYFLIRGADALYIVSRSWRGTPFDPLTMPITPAELADWTAFADAIDLCDGKDPARPCR